MIHEFAQKFGLENLLNQDFSTNDNKIRKHIDSKNAMQKIYSWRKPKHLLIDIDSSLFPTYGSLEGNSYNTHYSDYGYHPLLAYDGLTGDLLRAKLRPGSCYTSKDTTSFLEPLLEEFQQDYPDVPLFLRGDSGFADVLIYEKLESNGCCQLWRILLQSR